MKSIKRACIPFYFFCFFRFSINLQLIFNVPSISTVQQSDTAIHMYTFYFFFYTIFHHVLTQETGHSSLFYTAGPHYLSILNIIVCIYQLRTPHLSSSPHPPSPANTSLHLFLIQKKSRFCVN